MTVCATTTIGVALESAAAVGGMGVAGAGLAATLGAGAVGTFSALYDYLFTTNKMDDDERDYPYKWYEDCDSDYYYDLKGRSFSSSLSRNERGLWSVWSMSCPPRLFRSTPTASFRDLCDTFDVRTTVYDKRTRRYVEASKAVLVDRLTTFLKAAVVTESLQPLGLP